jgi:hypothetical protein
MKQADKWWFALADPGTDKGWQILNSKAEALLDQTDGINADYTLQESAKIRG